MRKRWIAAVAATALLVVAAGVVVAVYKGDAEPTRGEPVASGSAPVPDDSEDLPRPEIPRLPPEREAFWSRWIGDDPGAPGPEMLAWCSEPGLGERQERRVIGPDVDISRSSSGCALQAWAQKNDPSREMIKELHTALGRWQERHRHWWFDGRRGGTWIDAKHGLTAEINVFAGTDGGLPYTGPLFVFWWPHVSLETIIGTDGRILRDLDVESFVDAPVAVMRAKVAPPFQIKGCDDDPHGACIAHGPSPPGGGSVRVARVHDPEEVIIRLHADREEVLKLIEKSLGGRTRQEGDLIDFQPDAIRYRVDVSSEVIRISVERRGVDRLDVPPAK
ncbi:MAG: hypothetical protein KF773_20550 [Deltaproteobacteria bacterium]|nr:hypothetical protein [Deltaproteobacteria bacterium]MCW5803708.1 hypothetical protein [Deltaproteobacteria bacterium]